MEGGVNYCAASTKSADEPSLTSAEIGTASPSDASNLPSQEAEAVGGGYKDAMEAGVLPGGKYVGISPTPPSPAPPASDIGRSEPRKLGTEFSGSSKRDICVGNVPEENRAKEKISAEESFLDISMLDLPPYSSFNPGTEDSLDFFIGSNCLETNVQMYAEIESENYQTIAILHRDENDVIQTYFEPQNSPRSWYFSKESLEAVIEEAKHELEGYPDLREAEMG